MHANIITNEYQYLVNVAQQRFEFMYGAAHGLSYLLDPRYLGQHLLPSVRCNLEELLMNTPVDDVTIMLRLLMMIERTSCLSS